MLRTSTLRPRPITPALLCLLTLLACIERGGPQSEVIEQRIVALSANEEPDSLAFQIGEATAFVQRAAFQQRVELLFESGKLRPTARGKARTLLASRELIVLRPDRGLHDRLFWVLIDFIEAGDARIFLNNSPLRELDIRSLQNGNVFSREYRTREGLLIIAFPTLVVE
jgi:hypothetical protein